MSPIPPEAKLDVSASRPSDGAGRSTGAQAPAAGCGPSAGHQRPTVVGPAGARDRQACPQQGIARPATGIGYDAEVVEAVFTVGAALPVAALDGGDAATARAAAAALWMARLWGQRDGYACLCLGHGGHLSPTGRYVFDRFTQRLDRWPAGRARLLAEAMAAAGHADVYVGVLLRARPSRRAASPGQPPTALAGQVAWADVDGPWTAERAAALARLGGRLVWQVHSGSGRHLYLPLDQPEPPERLESWNRRFGALLAADAGWSQTKLLRLPGTFNHKPRAHGRPAQPVVWLP
jgi:hypothetical protein